LVGLSDFFDNHVFFSLVESVHFHSVSPRTCIILIWKWINIWPLRIQIGIGYHWSMRIVLMDIVPVMSRLLRLDHLRLNTVIHIIPHIIITMLPQIIISTLLTNTNTSFFLVYIEHLKWPCFIRIVFLRHVSLFRLQKCHWSEHSSVDSSDDVVVSGVTVFPIMWQSFPSVIFIWSSNRISYIRELGTASIT